MSAGEAGLMNISVCAEGNWRTKHASTHALYIHMHVYIYYIYYIHVCNIQYHIHLYYLCYSVHSRPYTLAYAHTHLRTHITHTLSAVCIMASSSVSAGRRPISAIASRICQAPTTSQIQLKVSGTIIQYAQNNPINFIWAEHKYTSVRSSEPLLSVSYELNRMMMCDCSFSMGIFLKWSQSTLDDDSIVFLLLSRKPPQLSCAARIRSMIAACSGVSPMSSVLDLFASAGTDLQLPTFSRSDGVVQCSTGAQGVARGSAHGDKAGCKELTRVRHSSFSALRHTDVRPFQDWAYCSLLHAHCSAQHSDASRNRYLRSSAHEAAIAETRFFYLLYDTGHCFVRYMGIFCRNSRHFLGCRPYLRICGERRTKLVWAYADPNHAPDLTCFIQTPTPLCPTLVPAALCREWRVYVARSVHRTRVPALSPIRNQMWTLLSIPAMLCFPALQELHPVETVTQGRRHGQVQTNANWLMHSRTMFPSNPVLGALKSQLRNCPWTDNTCSHTYLSCAASTPPYRFTKRFGF